jgi:hypothetical protein
MNFMFIPKVFQTPKSETLLVGLKHFGLKRYTQPVPTGHLLYSELCVHNATGLKGGRQENFCARSLLPRKKQSSPQGQALAHQRERHTPYLQERLSGTTCITWPWALGRSLWVAGHSCSGPQSHDSGFVGSPFLNHCLLLGLLW